MCASWCEQVEFHTSVQRDGLLNTCFTRCLISFPRQLKGMGFQIHSCSVRGKDQQLTCWGLYKSLWFNTNIWYVVSLGFKSASYFIQVIIEIITRKFLWRQLLFLIREHLPVFCFSECTKFPRLVKLSQEETIQGQAKSIKNTSIKTCYHNTLREIFSYWWISGFHKVVLNPVCF